jgi:hypothetical protein
VRIESELLIDANLKSLSGDLQTPPEGANTVSPLEIAKCLVHGPAEILRPALGLAGVISASRSGGIVIGLCEDDMMRVNLENRFYIQINLSQNNNPGV